jgi:heavy metal sensor kinase
VIRAQLDLLRRAKSQTRSLRFRLTLWYLAILLTTLVGSAVFLYLGLAHDLRSDMDDSLTQVSEKVLEPDPHDMPEFDMDTLPPGHAATLYDRDGRPYATLGSREALPLAGGDVGDLLNGHTMWRSVTYRGDPWRVFARPVVVNARVVATVQVGRAEDAVARAVDRLGILLTTIVPMALLFAGIGGLFLAGRAFGPIDRITRTAAAISAEDLQGRLPDEVARTPGELGRLATTFNHMLDRLERAFRRQRQFTADASHELRAPLSVALGQVDVALQRPRTADEYQEVLHGLREDIIRLRGLVSALLELARADAHQTQLVSEPIDLGELVHQVAEAMAPLADERGVRLQTQPSPGVVIQGDQARLMQLLVNLVDNGLNYTPRGGSVCIGNQRGDEANTAVLFVSDTGRGIAPEHLPHVFERFYRADPARSAGGAGLGLAISSWIAQMHGGRIEVESQPGDGSTFRVWLRQT